MQLYELFGDTADFKITKSTATNWIAETETPNGKLQVSASYFKSTEDHIKNWYLVFSVGGNFAVTGKGDQFNVFKLVVAMLKAFQDEKNPDQIYLSSDSENRTALYMRMFKRGLPSWKIIQFKKRTGDDIIAACKGSEFPVNVYDIEGDEDGIKAFIGVRYSGVYEVLGYQVDELGKIMPSERLEDITGLGSQLAPELKKAKEMAREYVAKEFK